MVRFRGQDRNRSIMEKIWQYKNSKLPAGKARYVSQKYSIPEMAATILLNRGVSEDEIETFLKKSMRDIINPMLLSDMDKAAKRIIRAISNKEKITVYGDYDVDGITSTAMVYDFLHSQGADITYYIPDRKDEGYGINIMAVNKLQKSGTKLLITVDCGITAIGEVEFAKLQGMDVIITDHHTCKEKLPDAAEAIINPKKPDCGYPFDALAGVGVAFKLILAVTMLLKQNTTECFKKYVDLAAIGTIADVVSLTGENRIIVDKGLKVLQNPQRLGIAALKEVAQIGDKPMTASHVAFALAPRLNAAGRLGTATTAVELLLTKDRNEARRIAGELDAENRERQATEQDIYNEALEIIAGDPNFDKKKVIVLSHEGWHHGVIGIVASRIGDLFYKPCILISYSNGIGKGSGRSIPEFNLFDALTACENYLTDFGGHAVAAGLNINMSDIDGFEKAINKYADGVLSERDMIPKLNIDCAITPAEATIRNTHMLSRLEPFGMGNEKPLFAITGMTVRDAMAVGSDKRHLKLRLEKDGVSLNAIGFGMGHMIEDLRPHDVVDAAFGLDINVYLGNESVQLLLKDLKRD